MQTLRSEALAKMERLSPTQSCGDEDELSEAARSGTDGEDLRPPSCRDAYPHRRHEPLHRTWHAGHAARGITASGVRGNPFKSGFVQQGPVDLNTDAFEVQLKTLKKRKDAWRIVPLPEVYFDTLQAVFNLRKMQATKVGQTTRIWDFSRQRVSQVAAQLFNSAGLEDFSPKACRHGFAISALGRGIPLTLVSEMMGHSSLEVTAIYARAMNSEKRAMVARMWD